MSELEQLRREVNELRERLARLESRKERLENVEWNLYRKERDRFLNEQNIPVGLPASYTRLVG